MRHHPSEGGCARRIRNALAALVDATRANLVIVDSGEAEVDPFIDATTRRTKEFERKVFDLYQAIHKPKSHYLRGNPYTPPPAIELPTDDRLPTAIRGALDRTADCLQRLMLIWEWIGENSDPEIKPPVGRIERRDFDRLAGCLTQLDDALISRPVSSRRPPPPPVEPPPTNSSSADMPPPRRPPPPAAPPPKPDIREVRRIFGKPASVDIARTRRWSGQGEINPESAAMEWTDLRRTPGGRWIRHTRHEVSLWYGDTPDFLEEVDATEAVRWFQHTWDRQGDGMPADLVALIAKDDIDSQPQPESTAGPDGPKDDRDFRFEHIRMIDGRTLLLNLTRARCWMGRKEFEPGPEEFHQQDLYWTSSGTWIVHESWQSIDPEFSPIKGDNWTEVDMDGAATWFARCWDRRGHSMPEAVHQRLESGVTLAVQQEGTVEASDEAETLGEDLKGWSNGSFKVHKKSLVKAKLAEYAEKGLPIPSNADLARECGVSDGYVSKVVGPIKALLRKPTPRGAKDRDGNIEAFE